MPFDRKRIHCTANFMLEFRYLKYRENGEIETPIQLRLTSKTYCLPISPKQGFAAGQSNLKV